MTAGVLRLERGCFLSTPSSQCNFISLAFFIFSHSFFHSKRACTHTQSHKETNTRTCKQRKKVKGVRCLAQCATAPLHVATSFVGVAPKSHLLSWSTLKHHPLHYPTCPQSTHLSSCISIIAIP
ncbi:hypothetical protein TRVL_09227 [Trypanosoma vivax]|nr:hypothetical protein TRVL_09227 [Trypanosoma vivax]